MTSRGVIFLYFCAAWAHSTHEIYCFLSLSFAFAHTTVCYTNSQNYSDRSPVSVHWRLCPFDYDMILCSQWISSDSGMSGTRRHIRLCHYTPTWPPPFQWTSPCVPCLPFKHRLRHKAKLEFPSYYSRCPLFHIYTCITRLAPSVVDNMYRQALLRWMIQFFSDTDILNRRVDNIGTVRLATLQSQDWTTLQQSDLATPHTVRGALGKPTRHTWRRGAL